MSTSSWMTRRAVVGGLVLVCLPAVSVAQDAGQLRPVTHVASIAAGSIQGTVQDEQGSPHVLNHGVTERLDAERILRPDDARELPAQVVAVSEIEGA